MTLKREPICVDHTVQGPVLPRLRRPIIGARMGRGPCKERLGSGYRVASGEPRRWPTRVVTLYRTPAIAKTHGRADAYFENHFERELLLRRLEA